jgi:simple sugar transport system permease protein
MNNLLFSIFITAAPLILIGTGALISEYTGTLAVFIDGIINLGSFLCFLFVVQTGSATIGILLAIIICTIIVFILCFFTIYTKANPFLTGLSINFLSTGVISFLSQHIFKTTSVLSEPSNIFNAHTFFISNTSFTIFAWIISIAILLLIQKTAWGTHLRISGSDPEVLEARGLSTLQYKLTSWSIAAALAAFAGCIYTFRLSAFVPNISSGRGWIALSAVFIGRKKGWGTLTVLVLFAIVDYAATALQGTEICNISPTLLLSLPYIAALILFIFQPNTKKN